MAKDSKMGRPTSAPRVNQLRLRLSDEEINILDECCKHTGMNKTQIMLNGLGMVYKSIKGK